MPLEIIAPSPRLDTYSPRSSSAPDGDRTERNSRVLRKTCSKHSMANEARVSPMASCWSTFAGVLRSSIDFCSTEFLGKSSPVSGSTPWTSAWSCGRQGPPATGGLSISIDTHYAPGSAELRSTALGSHWIFVRTTFVCSDLLSVTRAAGGRERLEAALGAHTLPHTHAERRPPGDARDQLGSLPDRRRAHL
jgi:hypothetical protein